MKMEISKDEFEQTILVATSSHSEVYDSVKPHFIGAYDKIKSFFIGSDGIKYLDETEDFQPLLKRWVCLEAFLSVVRHLDLVLTPTGFGVVSNGEVSPASASRVESLVEQVRQAWQCAKEQAVLTLLGSLHGWGCSSFGERCVPTLLWGYQDYKVEARLEQLTTSDWQLAQTHIQTADEILRRRISNEQMDALLSHLRSGKPWTEPMQKAVNLMRSYMVRYSDTAYFTPNEMKSLLDRLQTLMDADADTFAPYHASSEYRRNHFKPYENKKSNPAYIFI